MKSLTNRPLADAEKPTDNELAALRRLISIGRGHTGQSLRAAKFLLAWWDAGRCGGFDFTNLWAVDRSTAQDMVVVFGLIARVDKYPIHIDESLEIEFQAISRVWGPDAGNC